MSDAAVIHAVFHEVFGRQPDFLSSFNDRLLAQKTIYLLQRLGVTCGDYSFRWYKHGPYSQQLQNTLLESSPSSDDLEKITFSKIGHSNIEKIKGMLEEPHAPYDEAQWFEALGSIQYLKRYRFPLLSRDNIISKLSELKPGLRDHLANSRAYDVLKKYSLIIDY